MAHQGAERDGRVENSHGLSSVPEVLQALDRRSLEPHHALPHDDLPEVSADLGRPAMNWRSLPMAGRAVHHTNQIRGDPSAPAADQASRAELSRSSKMQSQLRCEGIASEGQIAPGMEQLQT